MRIVIISLIVSSLSISCSDSTKIHKENAIKTKALNQNRDTITEAASWADNLIIEYLEANREYLTEVESFPVTYFKETQIRNNKVYAAARIGHFFEHKYITDQWIFIDSITMAIYEYDLPNDSLIAWKTDH